MNGTRNSNACENRGLQRRRILVCRGIGEDIFMQGQTVDELYANIKEAVALHFDNITDLKK